MRIMIITVVFVGIMVGSIYLVSIQLSQGFDYVQKQGLKSIVNSIWEGQQSKP